MPERPEGCCAQIGPVPFFHSSLLNPERDELGYSSSFQRVLGETIRGWLGDQILVNATDPQPFVGTLGFSAAVVVMGWANVKAAAIGLGVGLLVGGGMNVLGQIDANWKSSGSFLWPSRR